MDENLFLVFVWSPILPMDLKVNVTEIVVVVISLYSSSVQDRHYKSWSAICQVRWKIWKPAVFWFFSFERFNGILGTMQVNGRSVEIQLMRKLIAGRFFWDVKFPNEFQEHFLSFFCNFFSKNESNDLSENFVVEMPLF